MSEERINIVIREDGSVIVKRRLAEVGDEMDKTGKKSKTLGDNLATLKNAMAGVAGALFLNELKKYMDSWITMTNRIALNTKTQNEARVVMDKLFDSAQKTRTSLDALTTLYQRGSQASKDLGASQQQLIEFSEGVGLAIAIQGTNAAKAKDMMVQLGQALGQGRVMSEEFNSVNEATPRILQAVANNLDAAGGSVTRLKKLVNDGHISNKIFFDAFMKEMPKLREEFAKSRPTFDQAFTVLNNGIARFLGETDEAVGLSTMLARAIIGLANNIEILGAALVGAAAGWAVYASPVVLTWLKAARTAVLALTAAIAANPIGALAVAIAAVSASLTVLRDRIMVNAEAGLTLGDYMWSAGQTIKSVVGQGISDLGKLWAKFWEGRGSMEAAVTMIKVLGAVFKAVANVMIGIAVGLWKTLYSLWDKGAIALAATLEGVWANMANKVIEFVNFNIHWINVLLRAAGENTINPIELFDMPKIGAAWADLTKDIRDNFDLSYDYIGAGSKGLQAIFDELTLGAVVRASGRNQPAEDLNTPPEGRAFAEDGDDKAIKKLRREYEALRASLDPIWSAQQELIKGSILLKQARDNEWISAKQYTDLMGRLKESLQDALDPMGAMQREHEKTIKLLGMSTKQRQLEEEVEKRSNKLKQDGLKLTPAILDNLRQQVSLETKLAEVREAINQLEQEMGSKDALIARQTALNAAFKEGTLGLDAYLSKSREVMVQQAAMQNANGQGTAMTVLTEGFGQFLDEYTTLAAGVSEIVGNMMTSLADGISDSLASAIVKGESLRDAFANISQTILTELLSALIKLGIQWAINSAMGQAAAAANMATSVAMGASVAAAWAPAAAAVSLATMGANSPMAVTGMATAYGAAKAFSVLPGFEHGGSFEVGGQGATDSQLVAFRASPSERVTIETPHQQRQNDKSSGEDISIAIVNVKDEEELYTALASARATRIIMNAVERNPKTIQKLSKGG